MLGNRPDWIVRWLLGKQAGAQSPSPVVQQRTDHTESASTPNPVSANWWLVALQKSMDFLDGFTNVYEYTLPIVTRMVRYRVESWQLPYLDGKWRTNLADAWLKIAASYEAQDADDRLGLVGVAVRVADVLPISLVIPFVRVAELRLQFVIPFRVFGVIAPLSCVAESKSLLAVLKRVLRSGCLLERVVDVLVHVASPIDSEVGLGLFPVIGKSLFDSLPGGEIVCSVKF